MLDLRLAYGVLTGFAVVFIVRYMSHKYNKAEEEDNTPREVETEKLAEVVNSTETDACACGKTEATSCCQTTPSTAVSVDPLAVRVFFGSQTGTAKEWAHHLAGNLRAEGFKPTVTDLATFEPDELVQHSLVFFVVATYTDGKAPDSCLGFFEWLNDFSHDFRVPKGFYSGLRYGLFGIGDSIYGKNYCSTAKEMDKMLQRLSANRIVPLGFGDSGTSVEIKDGYKPWFKQVQAALKKSQEKKQNKLNRTSEEPDELSDDEEVKESIADMEDMGKFMKPKDNKVVKKVVVIEEEEEDEEDDDDDDDDGLLKPGEEPKEMLTESLRKSLTKQGYRLLGSHSGVKMCRWTKAMMRGRGGCYKHTFYGITSSQCMEMTPSLACANKCVFCWRHHKNPVGKEWRWVVDEPEMLVDSAIKNHYGMIKQFRGVPGVTKDTYEEASKIRHCALSLVGEPIIYPHINKFLQLLHEKDISSFMVTNAQFPDKIETLDPVTQLYVSIDAGTKESLKKVDRPLFTDFWERFIGSIEALKRKGQRTVFRLTLINGWNTEEIMNYAQLVELGGPTLIEIKGVTYCGNSKASTLTMKNVPYHQEVLNFSQALCDATQFTRDNYEIACEHEHSCCVLLANKRFKINGQWHTWINYDKFHSLVRSGEEFTAEDYMAPTPYWAVVGSQEKGFDPEQIRHKRTKPYAKQGC